MRIWTLLTFGLLFMVSACNMPSQQKKTDYYHLPTYTEKGVNVVIEIPAGSNLKVEYDAENLAFVADQINGKDRIIDFLPYPGNYGFIPSTYMDKELGGDGDPLDVLVMSSAVPEGTVMEVEPIGMLELIDGGELDTKLIAVPIDPAYKVMDVENFQDFLLRYDGARRIVETWFLQYKGVGKTELKAWKDEIAALEEIEKWAK